eukprot:7310834-Alexandrium_andersonii.AAC.1
MSASLVGSEMCIRDRPHPALRLTLRGRRTPSSRRGRGRACSPVGKLSMTCLLYTSDAADDM